MNIAIDVFTTTNCKQISSKLVDGSKQDEIPLEKEINRIKLDQASVNQSISDALRYLHDEIQKLK